jgi:hypothetical protein
VSLVLDEFQEICGLKESKQIEAFLREGMQRARTLEAGGAGLNLTKQVLVRSEASDFENIFVNLAHNQKKVLKAVARKPSANIYASDYLRGMHLGAASSVRTAVKRLDLIEQRAGVWRTVDPILEKWLCSQTV